MLRVVIADDSDLLRVGLDWLISDVGGVEVVDHATDAPEITRCVAERGCRRVAGSGFARGFPGRPRMVVELRPNLILLDASIPGDRVSALESRLKAADPTRNASSLPTTLSGRASPSQAAPT